MKNKKNISLWLCYIFSTVFAFPVFRYLFCYILRFKPKAEDEFILVRVLFSGPMLILIGAFLIIKFMKIHRVLGLLTMLVGLIWLIAVFNAVMSELHNGITVNHYQ